MILRLVGPEDEFEVDYWMEDVAPSVVYNDKRVWVKGANSIPGDGVHRYFEQFRGRYIPESFMRKIEKAPHADSTD